MVEISLVEIDIKQVLSNIGQVINNGIRLNSTVRSPTLQRV
jgi:hypothetical protein